MSPTKSIPPRCEPTWRDLQAFSFDQPEASVGFADKLAAEQGWDVVFARRVIEEYRRFLLLGCHADHRVSPSDAVDQAWHQHLTDTRSYWGRLCREVLGKPFHHEPGQGRPGEREQLAQNYRDTLATYEAWWGHAPPEDIWPRPPSNKNRSPAPRHRRVNLQRNWVVPKPRHAAWVTAGVAALGGLLLIGGCGIQSEGSVLDYRGPDFLKFFIVFLTAFLVAARILRWRMRGPGPLPGNDEVVADWVDDPYHWAWLGGSHRRGTACALARLIRADLVKTDSTAREVVPTGKDPISADPLHPLEQALLEAVRAKPCKMAELHKISEEWGAPIEADLHEHRLVMGANQRGRARWRPFWLAMVPICLGILKISVGISRDKPVGFLVVLTGLGLLAAVLLVGAKPTWRSRRGDAVLKRKQERTQQEAGGGWSPGMADDMMLLGVGLFGAVALREMGLPDLHGFIHRSGGDNFYGTSDHGGSSCGGGDGGGGDGGGGCGGCGGD